MSVSRVLALAGAGALLASQASGAQSPPAVAPPPPVPAPAATPGLSLSLGVPWCGRLVRGVPLATGSSYFFTWDLALGFHPNPPWRRYGTARLIATLREVTSAQHRAHPTAPRVGIADLSLPGGGPFGPSYGGLGHLSHQNGLDADVLYPRRDGLEAAAESPREVDRLRSQELVDRFVAAGAEHVFVGFGLGLRGPRGAVAAIPHHLDHMHVRIAPRGVARAPRRCPWRPE